KENNTSPSTTHRYNQPKFLGVVAMARGDSEPSGSGDNAPPNTTLEIKPAGKINCILLLLKTKARTLVHEACRTNRRSGYPAMPCVKRRHCTPVQNHDFFTSCSVASLLLAIRIARHHIG